MKLTKSQLKQIIKETLDEVFGLEIPIDKKQEETPQPVDVLNNIRDMWPAQDSGDREKIQALEDIYRFLDKALVGTHQQPGLMHLKETYINPEDLPPGADAPGLPEEKLIHRLMVRNAVENLPPEEVAAELGFEDDEEVIKTISKIQSDKMLGAPEDSDEWERGQYGRDRYRTGGSSISATEFEKSTGLRWPFKLRPT